MDKLAQEIEKMATNSPSSISTTKAYGKSWILTRGEILNIYGNIEDGDYEEKIDLKKLRAIQIARKFVVNEITLRKLNIAFLNNPELHFGETFNGFGPFNDLEFLKHLPNLKNFGFYTFGQIDISPIRKYVQLNHLGLGGYNIPLREIEANPYLLSFGFGEKIKDTKTISTFYQLENLRVSGQKLKGLDFVIPLKKLKRITFSLGGTTTFESLEMVEGLEELEIWRTRQLEVEHLVPINKIKTLRVLKLRQLPRITRLNWLNNSTVQTLVLDSLKGLNTFDSLREIPHLNELIIIDRIDEKGLLSIQKLGNIDTIQVPDMYLNELSMSENGMKFKKIESKYML